MSYTKDIGIRDFYNFYVETSIKKGRPYKDYKTYSTMLKEINLELRSLIIDRSETITLPYRLGRLSVRKFEMSYTDKNKKQWRVDFQATKKAGHVVYYGSPYGYKWKWDKRVCIVNGKRFYIFKPCRTASRLIADAINNKQIDFYSL